MFAAELNPSPENSLVIGDVDFSGGAGLRVGEDECGSPHHRRSLLALGFARRYGQLAIYEVTESGVAVLDALDGARR